MLTLGQAAKETGLSKPTLSKAIKKGRISANKNDLGHFEIDPTELFRVYPLNSNKARNPEQQNTTGLQGQVDVLRELIRQLESERNDLRNERDRWRQQATALLLPPLSPPAPRRRWWLFGKG